MSEAVTNFLVGLDAQLSETERRGLFKHERTLLSGQGAEITVRTPAGDRRVVNFCANNYLGLADDPRLCEAAVAALGKYGIGTASVRFICGTQDIHMRLEAAVADYLRHDDAILFAACFDANGGLFEPLFGPDDAIVSDSLNHASIIDGIRLCKARRYRYANGDMDDLEARLRQADAEGGGAKIVVTDGVFSMDGYIANLEGICDLAKRHGALVMVDDCHATGVLGDEGKSVV